MNPEGPSFESQGKEGCREAEESCNEDPLFKGCVVLQGHRSDSQATRQGMVRTLS